jgi:hypothetical protein
MIKSTLQYSFFIFVAVFLSSCEDVVQIKLDEGSKLFVIDAFVNNMYGKQTIRVTTNDSYFSNRQAPPVTDANVLLKDLTSGKSFQFVYSSNGNYDFNAAGADSLGLVDHQYQLNVTIDGYTYSSVTIEKRTASIDSISAEVFDPNAQGGFGGGPPGPPFSFCTLWAKDKADNNTDYYWVKTFRNDSLLFSANDINVSIDGTNGAVMDAGVDSIAFTPPVTFIGFKQYQSGTSCAVEIHSISKETYFFFVQAAAQINNGGLFATTPENVKTNITTPADAKTKAIGWFNMATVTRKRIIVP